MDQREIKRELRKYFKLNENKDTTYQNLSNIATVALMGNLGQKWLKTISFHLKQLGKEQRIRPKKSRKKEII